MAEKAPCPCIKMWENTDKLFEQLAAKRGKVYDPSKSLVARLAAQKQEDSLREAVRKDARAALSCHGINGEQIFDPLAPITEQKVILTQIATVHLHEEKAHVGTRVTERKSIDLVNDFRTPVTVWAPTGRIVGGKRKAANEVFVPQKSRSD